MNILFDLGHPAHVHLFKNFISYLKVNGHLVVVTSRDKDVSNELLDHYGIEHVSISSAQDNFLGLFKELILRDYRLYQMNRKYKFDLAFGCSPSISHLSLVSNVKSFNFSEDDDDYTLLYTWLAYPFTTKIINHNGVRYRRFGSKRIFHNAYQKLAYLHPNNFTPSIDKLSKYGLKPYDYILIRRSALKAHHDLKATGLQGKVWDKVSSVTKDCRLVFSNEVDKKHQIEPWDMHDVLSFAKFVVTDSLSMSVEASVLGVPVIRYNSFEGKSTVLNELENKYGLACGYNSNKAGSEKLLIEKIKEFLSAKDLNKTWQSRRNKMLQKKEDLNEWMINFFENNLNKGPNA